MPSLALLAMSTFSSNDLQRIKREFYPNGFPVMKLILPEVRFTDSDKPMIVATDILDSNEDGLACANVIQLHSVVRYLPKEIIATYYNNRRQNNQYKTQVFKKPTLTLTYLDFAYNYQHFLPWDTVDSDEAGNAKDTWFRFQTAYGFTFTKK